MSANIFISFASQDRKVAMTLCSALESRGFKCWISARDIAPGENFQSAIVRAIRQARIMLLVFTANSNNSEEMNKELALASQGKLIVVPLRIEDVAPNDAFAYEFATRQWIDFFADWEFAMQQLAQRIAAALQELIEADAAPAAADPLPQIEAIPPAEEVLAAPRVVAPPEPPAVAEAPVALEAPIATWDASEEEAPDEAPRRSRAPLYFALSAAAAAALAAILILPNALHQKQGPDARVMAAVHATTTPDGVQRVAIEVGPQAAAPAPAPLPVTQAAAAPAADADEAPPVEKPAPRRKKVVHTASTSDNYVPY